MKKLLLFLFISNFCFSQTDLEIRLVNPNIGQPLEWFLNSSNDAGLNEILQQCDVYSYESKLGHPYEPFYERTVNLSSNCEPNQLISNLLAYSSVIESVKIFASNYFSDATSLKLIDGNIGVPIGFNNNIVETNDIGLNQIFQDFNVYHYIQASPSSGSGSSFFNVYYTVCNCDVYLLKTALENYTSTIEYSELLFASYLLENNQFEKSKTQISPNPFSNNFDIQTNETIVNYTLYDVAGKQLISSTSKNELDNLTPKLNQGIYFLNLQFENGEKSTYKIVKK